jgi:hypothetical protein
MSNLSDRQITLKISHGANMTTIRTSSAIWQLARSHRSHIQPFSSYAIRARRKPEHHLISTRCLLHTSNGRTVDGPSRYGTAKEPPPHLKEGEQPKEDLEEHDEHDEEDHGLPPTSSSPAEAKAEGQAQATAKAKAKADAKASEELEQKLAAEKPAPESKVEMKSEQQLEQQPEQQPEPPQQKESPEQTSSPPDPETPIILPSPEAVAQAELHTISDFDGPSSSQSSLDSVLDLHSPTSQLEDNKPPHLQTPRYVHHFDTYSLVRELQKCGFTDKQATSMMKAVRGILAEHIELARRALVSKSNVENETYLFRAACSELKTEVQNNRNAEADKWRSQRAQQQHEVDILTQKMMQDLGHLKDDMRGSFDDRKMTVRMEEKKIEANVGITLDLNNADIDRFKTSIIKSPGCLVQTQEV